MSEKQKALLKALFVTFLWSTSWIFVKNELHAIPPLFFAGSRYFIAFIVLLIYYNAKGNAYKLQNLEKQDWISLLSLGFLFVFMTQGLLILTLDNLSAITTSIVLNFSALLIAILGVIFLKENLQAVQWGGIIVFLVGIYVYFTPISLSEGSSFGLLLGGLTVVANSISSVIGRFVNRSKRIDPLTVTVVSIGFGSALLLIVGLIADPIPVLTLSQWAVIFWLAIVNTSFAFVVWNGTLQILHVAESSMINNTMMTQIAILAWFYLGETPTPKEWGGMLIATVGIMFVTGIRKKKTEIKN